MHSPFGATAMGAVRSWIRKPLTPKPVNSEIDRLADRALFAAMSRALVTIVGTYLTS